MKFMIIPNFLSFLVGFTLCFIIYNLGNTNILKEYYTRYGQVESGDGVNKTTLEAAKKLHLLCWVMTSPKSLYSKGKAVKETWGTKCDTLLFLSTQEDKAFPAIALNVTEGYGNLWKKSKASWQYVYDHYYTIADWFIKVDDDTYLIVENLKYFLASYDTNKPHYFGHHIQNYRGYCGGGGGNVFSKNTLKVFEEAMKDPVKCPRHPAEDVAVGTCLFWRGITPNDSRDALGRERFHSQAAHGHIAGRISGGDRKWLTTYSRWPVKFGSECCSDYTISFHYVSPDQMYVWNFFIYRLKAYNLTIS